MPIDALLAPHARDLGGGFTVRRVLPAAARRAVGPFIFFDHFGPVEEQPDEAHDVRPHPHIGLATVTYLFEGAIHHRDSIGSSQVIEPGAVNWMSAGRGIVHSERRPAHLQHSRYRNHGLQLWAALPLAQEESEPSFTHVAAADVPTLALAPATVRLLIGRALGARSPVPAAEGSLFLDVALPAGAGWSLPPLAAEMAVHAVSDGLRVDGQAVPAGHMAVLTPGTVAQVQAGPAEAARCAVIGGEPLDAPRHLWWNFVSSRADRIGQAADAWRRQAMGQVAGDPEFIALPDRPLPTAFQPRDGS